MKKGILGLLVLIIASGLSACDSSVEKVTSTDHRDSEYVQNLNKMDEMSKEELYEIFIGYMNEDKVQLAKGASDTLRKNYPDSYESNQAEEHWTKYENKDDGGITLDKFEQIQLGMSHEEVVDIVGEGGELSSQSETAGYYSEIYTFKSKDASKVGANAIIQFQNGQVVGKSQAGL